MSLVSASDLAKSFGPDDIFSGISLSIPRGARIAIVGPNGIGKSTLLRILVGLDEPSAGRVHKARNLKIGYLPQEAALHGAHTLWAECLAAMADLRAQEAELARLEAAMSDPGQADEVLERYGKMQEDFERRGGYTYETRIRQTLTGLGFAPGDFKRPLPQLSGGQRTRALLARLLLSDPDLLVLDEPTNHLDIQAVEWLEGYLSQWEGAVLIVSHDRYFLDRVVDHIWEMRSGGLEVYRGNYSAYLQQRQERWELRQQIYAAEKERLEKELDYVKRNIAGQGTRQAKGKLRRLSREVQAIEKLGFEVLQSSSWAEISNQIDISSHPMGVDELERRIRSLRGPSNRPPQLHLHLKASQRSGDLVLRTRDLAIGYFDEGRPLFRSPDLLLKRGECAAVIGPNGAGKTTFLKTLLNQMPPLQGEVILGASLQIGYFAQAHEDLRPERTLVEEIEAVAPHMLLAEMRNYLARFLFTGEDVFRKVATLSGGERGRLALAKLSLTNANLLLLDEPTNHLDIPSQEILQEVLAGYQGTILLVSHDRYLIDALGTQIWEILPGEANLQVFEGDYTQYRQHLEKLNAEQTAKVALTQEAIQRKSRPTPPSPEEKKRRALLKQVEERITFLETELTRLSRQLENPPTELAKLQRLGQEYAAYQNEIESLLIEWEQLNTALESKRDR
ncbi:MAG: ABC-F family ATP-binding cassette domain-containing protein [Anaerolineales bacterium]|nr:ABC-F family ATP-binding cassette domain-containing protein [Anaerolineales bacterium]